MDSSLRAEGLQRVSCFYEYISSKSKTKYIVEYEIYLDKSVPGSIYAM